MRKTKDRTPLERFETPTKKLMAVPKEEADRAAAELRQQRKDKKA